MIRSEHVQSYLDGLRPARDPLLAEMEELARRDGVPIVEWETGRFLATLAAGLAPPAVPEGGTPSGHPALPLGPHPPPGPENLHPRPRPGPRRAGHLLRPLRPAWRRRCRARA